MALTKTVSNNGHIEGPKVSGKIDLRKPLMPGMRHITDEKTNLAMPVLIEDMQNMIPKVVVSEGFLRTLIGLCTGSGEISVYDLKRALRNRLEKATTKQEYVEILASEVDFHVNIELIRAYLLPEKES